MKNLNQNLKELKDESQVFGLLTQGEKTWDNIFEGFKTFKQNNNYSYESFPNTLINEKHLDFFDKMGIDYNYKDCYGSNFLHYIYMLKDERTSNFSGSYNSSKFFRFSYEKN